MEETIILNNLLQTLRKRVSLILSITFIMILIGGVISYFFLKPVYEGSTQLLVNQAKSEQTTMQYNEVQTNLQLINTYNVIIKSPAILELVIKDLNLDMSVEELNEKITILNEQSSQVVNLTVKDSSANRAVKIANKTAEVFKSEIVNIMNVDNVNILAKATVPEDPSPIKPKPLLNILIAALVGLLVGIGISIVLEYLDNSVKDEQDIEKLIGVPVLGAIATMGDLQHTKKRRSERNARLRGESVGS